MFFRYFHAGLDIFLSVVESGEQIGASSTGAKDQMPLCCRQQLRPNLLTSRPQEIPAFSAQCRAKGDAQRFLPKEEKMRQGGVTGSLLFVKELYSQGFTAQHDPQTTARFSTASQLIIRGTGAGKATTSREPTAPLIAHSAAPPNY